MLEVLVKAWNQIFDRGELLLYRWKSVPIMSYVVSLKASRDRALLSSIAIRNWAPTFPINSTSLVSTWLGSWIKSAQKSVSGIRGNGLAIVVVNPWIYLLLKHTILRELFVDGCYRRSLGIGVRGRSSGHFESWGIRPWDAGHGELSMVLTVRYLLIGEYTRISIGQVIEVW